jgi:LacI family transcriptional regulator
MTALPRTDRPATLTQVAQRAGVSLTTASKAINNQSRIAPATRERVMRAAAELNFVPNPHARSLHTGRTSIVGALILDSKAQRFAMPLIIGADTALSEINLSMIACDAQGDPRRALELVEMLRARTVDGLLVIGEYQDIWPSLSDKFERPVVYIHGETDNPNDVVFMPDDEDGMGQVVEHLVQLGRRRIACITGPRRARAVQQRVLGLRAHLKAHRLRIAAPIVYGEWSQRSGRRAMEAIINSGTPLDAVICGSDQIAAGAVDVLLAHGIRIPDDIAITGFDNWAVFAHETEPPLTTVDMNLEALGISAGQALFAGIDGMPLAGGVRRQACSLVVRSSTVGDGGDARAPR